MSTIGLSVPPGLTISTEACQEYQQNGKKLSEGLWEEVLEGLETVEKEMGALLGDPSKPLLLSVRSGAAVLIFLVNFFHVCFLFVSSVSYIKSIFSFLFVCLDINAWHDGHGP